MTDNVSQIEYGPRIVGFLDILGFSSLAGQTTAEAKEAICRLDQALDQVELEKREHEQWGLEFSYRMFSDCICLSSEFSDRGLAAVAESAKVLALWCTQFGVSLRGGIAAGRHYESKVMLFSEGLVRAYRLESAAAVYPRVVFEPDLFDDNNRLAIPVHTRIDTDGSRFLDYLEWCSKQESESRESHPWAVHRRFVMDGLRISLVESVRAKYVWLGRYHNMKVDEVCDRDGERQNGVNRLLKIPEKLLAQ